MLYTVGYAACVGRIHHNRAINRLAITGVLIATSLFYLSGRVEADRFSQSMRDIQSRVQDWINDAPTGFAGSRSNGPSDAQCKTVAGPGSRPKIDKNTGSPLSAGECIYLGKSIQFTDGATAPPTSGQDRIVYVYSVFGSRNVSSGGDERPSANLVEANPVAADSYGPAGNIDLTEDYHLTGDSKVLSVSSDGSVPNSHLAGFYLSFNQESNTRNGAQDLRAYQYPIPGNLGPGTINGPTGAPVNDCINMNSTSPCAVPFALPQSQWGSWPPPLQNWHICFGNDSNSKTAMLTIRSSTGVGAGTKLEFKACT